MPLVGNTKDIAAIRNVVQQMTKVPSRTSRLAIPALNRRVAQMFTRGQDPYGNAWAPLKPSTIRRKKGDARILIRKFQLAPGTFFAPASGAGIKMIVGPAGNYAQDGSPVRVPRVVVPQYGLPATWSDDIDRAARQAAKQASRGA